MLVEDAFIYALCMCIHRFEDGTVSFLDIVALRHGFEALKRFGITMETISAHTFALAHYVNDRLSSLRHSNKQRVCIVYTNGEFSKEQHGGIIAFNLVRSNGQFIGYSEVRERKRERERERERDGDRKRETETERDRKRDRDEETDRLTDRELVALTCLAPSPGG